jgi:nicotinamidase-related amidase
MMDRLVRDDCLVLVVDVQERLAPAIADGAAVIAACRMLVLAARRLGVPVLASEQYPQGLGPTVAALRASLGEAQRLAKTAFSCAAEPAIAAAVEASGRRTLLVCGMEAHVCVLQSALDFRRRGLAVALVADATGSRRAESRALALERARAAGCAVVDVEMAVFEWLERAGTAEFRALAPLLKAGVAP